MAEQGKDGGTTKAAECACAPLAEVMMVMMFTRLRNQNTIAINMSSYVNR